MKCYNHFEGGNLRYTNNEEEKHAECLCETPETVRCGRVEGAHKFCPKLKMRNMCSVCGACVIPKLNVRVDTFTTGH